MKFEKNQKYTTIAIYTFIVIAASILFYLFLQNVSGLFGWIGTLVGYVMPVIYGFVFAFLLNPLMRQFDDRLLPKISRDRLKPKARRGIAIALTYFCAIIMVTLFLSSVLPQVVFSLTSIVSSIPTYLKTATDLYDSLVEQLNSLQILQSTDSNEIIQNIATSLLSSVASIFEMLNEFLRGIMTYLFSATARFTTGILNVVLGIIISIYFLADREMLFAQLKKITKALFPQRTCDLLYDVAYESNRIFNGFIVGKIIDSIIIGILCFIIMSIINLPDAMLISLIVGITNVIPYFGPFIGAIPGALLLLVSGPDGPIRCLIFLIMILILQQFDGNILGPKILGDTTGLSAFWVVFAILLFSGMLGILGMFIGVPVFAILYSMGKRFIAYLLRRKGESPNTRDYASDRNPLIK